MENLEAVYRLWWEYLKRSKDYKILCDWTVSCLTQEENRNYPLEPCEVTNNVYIIGGTPLDIKHWIDNMVTKWIESDDENPFPCPHYRFNKKHASYHMLYGYMPFFGNVHLSTFQQFWEDFTSRINCCPEMINRTPVSYASETIGSLWDQALSIFASFKHNENPSANEFKDYFIHWMNLVRPRELYISIQTQDSNVKSLARDVAKLISAYRNTTQGDAAQSLKNNYRFPTSTTATEQLSRYILAFDLAQDNEVEFVVSQLYPGANSQQTENFDSLITMTYRYIRIAKQIIKNVENGKFPGRYMHVK